MIAFRAAIALASLSVVVLAGHGGGHSEGHHGELGYGHGSPYGYRLGGMSYGLNYGRGFSGGYSKPFIAKPAVIHGGYGHGLGLAHGISAGHGAALGHAMGLGHEVAIGRDGHHFGAYERDAALPATGFNKGYEMGHDLGHYTGYLAGSHSGAHDAPHAAGYGRALAGLTYEAPISIGKGYSALSHAGYGSLGGSHGAHKAIVSPPPVKDHGALGAGQGIGFSHGLLGYSKGLMAPLAAPKHFAAYGDELGYGANYAAHLDSARQSFAVGHGGPLYSGIVKAGVPVSLAHKL